MFFVLSTLFCAILIIIDQITKYLAVKFIAPLEYFNLINNVLQFRYVENTGAVFGSFATHTVLLTVFSIILLAFTIFYFVKNKDKSKFINICLLLMVSGGIGNLIDRIRLQYVIDFIEPLFVDFAVFNFADCLITVGAFLIIFYLIADIFKEIKNNRKSTRNDDGTN